MAAIRNLLTQRKRQGNKRTIGEQTDISVRRCAYRGGNWNNGANAGVFNVNLNNPRGNSNANIGGRSALPFAGNVCPALRGLIGAGAKRVCFPSVRRKAERKKSNQPRKRRRNPKRQTGQPRDRGGNVKRGAKGRRMSEQEPEGIAVLRDAFPLITSFEWLEQAYKKARKEKRYRPEVLEFTHNLDENLLRIQTELREGQFTFGPYRKHWVSVPKRRMVMALPFDSRVVQWAIYLLLNPFYDRMMIEDSYACRVGKGSLAAIKRLQYWLRLARNKPGQWYCLKLDISKYFYRIDHAVLMNILRRRITDTRLLELLDNIINCSGERFGLPRFASPEDTPPEEWLDDVGMPIGNLTSQLFANIYLNELDQHCKHVLHIRHYVRYMDDVIILAPNKRQAHFYRKRIADFLRDELHLDLNNKTAVRPADRPVEFVGYIATARRLKLRKSTVRRIKNSFRAICRKYFSGRLTQEEYRRRVASYQGMIAHCESGNLRARLNQIYRHEREAAHTSDIEMIMKLCGICEEMARIIAEQQKTIAQLGALDSMEQRIETVRAEYVRVIGADKWPDDLPEGGGEQ